MKREHAITKFSGIPRKKKRLNESKSENKIRETNPWQIQSFQAWILNRISTQSCRYITR